MLIISLPYLNVEHLLPASTDPYLPSFVFFLLSPFTHLLTFLTDAILLPFSLSHSSSHYSKQRHNSLWRSKSETNFNSSSGTSNSSENSSNASSSSSLAASPSSSSEPSSPTHSSVTGSNKTHEATGEGQSRSTGCKQVAQLAELFNNNAASHFHHHRHSLHNPHHSHTSILQIGLSIESLN